MTSVQLLRLVTALLGGTFFAGCGDPVMRWDEQVKLQSGEVILIKRTAKFRENRIAGGGGGSFNEGMTIQIVRPEKPDSPGIWDARFVPILLDVDPASGEWAIVATFFHCKSWYELGRPKLPYTEYRYRGGKWIQQPLSPQWIGRPANVLSADPAKRKMLAESKPALTVERKEGILYATPMSPEYKQVVEKWTSGC